jgi:PKD repeat protein
MKIKLLFILIFLFQLKISAQNCTYIQAIDTANNSITFTATDTLSVYNYIFVLDTTSVLNNLTGGHSATYQGFLNDTLPHEICLKIVDLINQVLICESCAIFQLGNTVPPPNPSCAFTYYFSNDTLYANQSGSITPADYVWNVNGNFYSGTQLALYVGNIDSIQVNLNGQNLQLGTSCFNSIYAVNPNYVPPSPSCAFTYYFSNDTLYASQTGSATPANYVWNVNGNFYSGSQLVLYVGNIDSIQVNLNGQNLQLGTSCFNSIYAVNPNYVPPSPSCAFTYYFSNDTLYANQTGSITPADYVWNVNGNSYQGTQLALYVGNIDSIQVNLNGQNVALGTNCFNTIYAVNPFYVPVVDHCNTDFVNVSSGLTGYFIDITSNNNPQQSIYYWTFGDGNSSNNRNVQHTYLVDGNYNVCLWVQDTLDNSHCNDTICKLISIGNSPISDTCSAYFVFTQIQTFNIGAINLASGINPVFSWNFGDGLQSIVNGPYPSYTYMNAGTYEVCLTLTTDSCSATYCDSLTVDSAGIMRDGMQEGFTINVLSPAQVTGIFDSESMIEKISSIQIYPNPSTGVFTISAAANIEVYNLIGDLILSENNATSIDLTASPKGMYFVKLNGGRIEKLIKN